MSYLGIDIAGARGLVDVLRDQAGQVDPIRHLLNQAETLAQLPVMVTLALDQIQADYLVVAAQVETAATAIESFRLQLEDLTSWEAVTAPAPSRTPVPVQENPSLALGRAENPLPPLWNAQPEMSWNLVRQDASHNSYAVSGGIGALYQQGVRTFELDIHRGAPISSPSDWRVFHVSGFDRSEYDYLSDGLAAVAALETTDPLTIFVDNKDNFGGPHTAQQLDRILDEQLGERLYTPREFLSRAPQAQNLSEVVQLAGWPTVDELDGRILVVLTDNIDGYGTETHESRAFVAPEPRLQVSQYRVMHLPEPDTVFYNANARRIGPAEVDAVSAGGNLLRTYFNPRCASATIGADLVAPNYRAVDIVPGEDKCPSPVPAPPEGRPIPEW